MNTTIETFLANIHALHQLEPQNLPKDVLHVMVQMSPEELFKTCSQFSVLRHNVPGKEAPITLSETQIASLAEAYLKELITYLKRKP